MNNKDILKIKKDNYAKNLNTLHSNTKSKGLEDNVKSYNKNLNLSKNNNYQNISNQQNSTIQRINSARLKNAYGNSLATNKAASAGLSAVGVPKPLADKVVNSEIGQKALDKVKKQVPALNMLNKLTGGNDSQELPSGSGGVNFQLSMKFIKIATISFIPTLVIIVFCCLFISASQVYSKAIGLGNADNVSLPDAESKIKDVKDDKLNEETTDDKVAFVGNVSKFMNSKLIQNNLVLDDSSKTVAKKRNFNEAEISKLEDYYSQAIDYSKQYDMDMVYTFYFKLYYINQYYQNKYHVNLDMPLIMATLNMQSTEMGDIFASNIKDYDFNSKSDNPYFAYDYDWTSYITTKTNSTHDIEVLAQNMVSETTDDKCTNPITKKDENGNDIKVCYVLDEDKYREFLKEFLEKKYYLENTPLTGSSTGNSNGNNNNNNDNNNDNNNEQQTGEWRNWKQCGQSWSSTIVPTSKSTMCKIGCAITSVTIQVAKSGTATVTNPIDPGVALKYYKFLSGGNLYWGTVSNLAPNFRYVTKINLVGMNKTAVAQKLSSYDSSRYYMILNVGKIGRHSAHHYVALDYIDTATSDLYMIDPGSSKNNNVYSTYRVYNAVIYEKKD